jgi:hypothetical protein
MQNGNLSFSGRTDTVLERYSLDVVKGYEGHGSRMINPNPPQNPLSEFYVKEVLILNAEGNTMPVLHTFDNVTFRFIFHAPRPIQRGALEFEIRSIEGVRLFRLATLPDSNFLLPLRSGLQSVDCVFDSLPLAAGDYVFGVGLAIPQVEWLWRAPDFGRITVMARDVYDSGRAPSTDRCLVAAPHRWRIS